VAELNWSWIALALTVQPIVALLAAVPFWRKDQMVLGNIAGTALIFASGVGLILREYVTLDRLTQACLDAGTVCWPNPSAFTRFAIYASIAMIEVFALFSLSLVVEERIRRRNYSREWQ
jgi:drug/metabolite transporter (DMT)-like permease